MSLDPRCLPRDPPPVGFKMQTTRCYMSIVSFAKSAAITSALLGVTSMPTARAQEPLKVGVMYPLGGVLGVMGGGSANAVKLAFDEEGNKIAGRAVQILVEDDEGKIDVSLTKLRKLVEL